MSLNNFAIARRASLQQIPEENSKDAYSFAADFIRTPQSNKGKLILIDDNEAGLDKRIPITNGQNVTQ